ncbi:MAG: methionine--tRNA ligase [bacterium]
MQKKFYITTPIYYANQRPHIGTAYTTVAGDVLARYYRSKGKQVFFLTGTDEYGEKIEQAAEKAGKSSQDFVDEISKTFKKAWKVLNISYDDFIRTTEQRHKKGVEKFLLKLKENKKIYQDDYRALYCVGCEDFIFKKDLTDDGKCPYHQKEPKMVSEKNYFFKLSDFLKQVKELIKSDEMVIEPKERKNEVLSLIEQDLDNFSISREKVKWGIPLPFDKKQVCYVWVEALQNYITAIGYENDQKKFDKFWPADIHLLAKDIVKFHAIFWPALLLANGLKLPKKIFVHGFFTVNGQKMSKTLGNVIDPIYLADKYGVDALRYFLMREISFGQDGDFSIKRLEERYNSDLANGLGNLVSRVLTLSEKIDVVPDKVKKFRDKELGKKIKSVQDKYEKAIKEIKLNEALEVVWKLIGFCDEYIERNKPWELSKSEPEKFKQIILYLLYALKEIAFLLEPFLPDTSEKILNQIKQNKKTETLFPRL